MGRHSRPSPARIGMYAALGLALCAAVLAGAAAGVARRHAPAPHPSVPAPRSVESTVAYAGWSAQAFGDDPSASVASTLTSSLTIEAQDSSGKAIAQLATSAAEPTTTPAPALPEFSVKRYLGTPLRTVPSNQHEVALTFDDGPGDDTGKVLGILAAHQAHATFFVVGMRARKRPSAVQEMVAQGHEVGNHTWNHPEPGSVSEAALAKQFDRNQKLITKLTGRTPRFARTRGGKYTAATIDELTSRGLILALWSIHSNDVEPSPSPEQIVRNATSGAVPGSIILLHETNPNTILALPAILRTLERKGLHPVTLSQLLSDDPSAKH